MSKTDKIEELLEILKNGVRLDLRRFNADGTLYDGGIEYIQANIPVFERKECRDELVGWK